MYKMVSRQISVSVSDEEREFMKEFNLSPSQLLKEGIWNLRGIMKKIAQERIMRLQKVIESQAEQIHHLENVVQEKNSAE